jgi:2-C-methyl-D-erythritol 4-phosphate cytidylyltransferase
MGISVIILAGGQGSRMNSKRNKVYLEIGDHLVIDYSLNIFNQIEEVSEIICVYREGERNTLEERVKRVVSNKNIKYINGGRERKDSVSNALKIMNKNNEYFAIHDGARPFITKDFVQSLIESAKKYDAVIPGLKVKDTIKLAKDGYVNKTLDRSKLVAIQTPQIFNIKYIDNLIEPEFVGTDDSSFIEIVEAVKIVDGLRYNIKITTKEDLWIAEGIIRKVEELHW